MQVAEGATGRQARPPGASSLRKMPKSKDTSLHVDDFNSLKAANDALLLRAEEIKRRAGEALFVACATGDVDAAEEAISEHTYFVNYRNPVYGLTPLEMAARHGHAQVVKTLLKLGAEVTRDILGTADSLSEDVREVFQFEVRLSQQKQQKTSELGEDYWCRKFSKSLTVLQAWKIGGKPNRALFSACSGRGDAALAERAIYEGETLTAASTAWRCFKSPRSAG